MIATHRLARECPVCAGFGHPCCFHSKVAAGLFNTAKRYMKKRALAAESRATERQALLREINAARTAELARRLQAPPPAAEEPPPEPPPAEPDRGPRSYSSDKDALEAVREMRRVILGLMESETRNGPPTNQGAAGL